MASFTDKAWDGSASEYPDAKSYCQCSLINTNTSDNTDDWTKDACKLPICEPDGTYNINGMRSAAGVLAGAMGGVKGVSAQDRKKAAKRLINLFGEAKVDPPDSLKKIAGS